MADTPTTRTIKQHDTWPPLPFALADANGPINLATATNVKFLAKMTQPVAATIHGDCVLVDPASGIGRYEWAAGDTAQPGSYRVEFEIDWGAGKIETIPNDNYDTLVVLEDLG
jgi:hypothetical protein